MAPSLEGRVGVVTGANGAFGREIALELAHEGVHLLLLDHDATALRTLRQEIAASGGRSTPAPVDVADASALESAIRAFEADQRPIDLLVVAAEEVELAAFGKGDPQRWHSLVDVNILGALFAVRVVLASLIAQGSGHIVLLSGVAGRETCPGAALYSATKWAVTGLGHALRSEAESLGIAVTVVEPGAALPSSSAGSSSSLAEAMPDGGMGRAVARTVVFALTQPPGASITEIVVRGAR